MHVMRSMHHVCDVIDAYNAIDTCDAIDAWMYAIGAYDVIDTCDAIM